MSYREARLGPCPRGTRRLAMLRPRAHPVAFEDDVPLVLRDTGMGIVDLDLEDAVVGGLSRARELAKMQVDPDAALLEARQREPLAEVADAGRERVARRESTDESRRPPGQLARPLGGRDLAENPGRHPRARGRRPPA